MGFSSSICPSEGKWALTHRSSFPSWDKMLQDSSAHAVPCCGEGRCWQKFLLISSLHPDSFPLFIACYCLLLGRREFYNFSSFWRCLLRSALSRFSPASAQRGWGKFTGSSGSAAYWGVSAYYQMHMWARLLQGLLGYGAGSHNSLRGTLVWMVA